MGILSCIETVSASPLLPAEVVRRLQESTLPLANNSWQDSYQIHYAQPFQGTIESNAFELSRISVPRIRGSKPLIIKGWVQAATDGVGSVVRLRYYQPSMLWLIVGLCAMAASLGTAMVLQDLRTTGRVNPLVIIYLALPIWGMIAQYFQVRNEMAISQPLLAELLMLKDSAA